MTLIHVSAQRIGAERPEDEPKILSAVRPFTMPIVPTPTNLQISMLAELSAWIKETEFKPDANIFPLLVWGAITAPGGRDGLEPLINFAYTIQPNGNIVKPPLGLEA